MDAPRTTSELAAIVRAGLPTRVTALKGSPTDLMHAALDRLEEAVNDKDAAIGVVERLHAEAVARVTDLEAQLAERPTLEEAMLNVTYWKDKAVAAEAQVAALTQERDEALDRESGTSDALSTERGLLLSTKTRAEAAEAALAETRQALAELTEHIFWTSAVNGERVGPHGGWSECPICRRALAATEEPA